jgi:hypothetical protein
MQARVGANGEVRLWQHHSTPSCPRKTMQQRHKGGQDQVMLRSCARHFDQLSIQQFPFATFLFRKRIVLLGRDQCPDRLMPFMIPLQ